MTAQPVDDMRLSVTKAGKSYNKYWQERSRYCPLGNYTPVPADFDLEDKSFKFSGNYLDWPWANDPCSILYNEKDGLYYSWMLYRDHVGDGFPTDWIEMVSEDCVNWRQTEKRLERGVHAISPWGKDRDVSFMGGSAWIDKTNRFGFGAGAVLFLVSMNHCIINGERGYDQSVALFVAPKGLGTPVDTGKSCFIFAENQAGTDWRDTRMQWDADNDQLIFAISNHQNVQFYVNKTNNIKEFEHTQTFDTGYESGIECPEFHPITDSATGEKYWLLVTAKQVPRGGVKEPEQTVLWYLGKWDGAAFNAVSQGVLEYGYDFYAQSVSEPRQNDNPVSLIMRGYAGNWGYTPDIKDWPQKGFVGCCWEDREIYVENGIAKVRPLLKTDKARGMKQPPAKTVPTWIKARLYSANTRPYSANKSGVYALQWSSGDKVLLDIGSIIRFDTAASGAAVLPGKAFAPMPVGEAAELDIFINGCCLSVYINGMQAGFQIFPRGHFTGLKHINGAVKVRSVAYYNMSYNMSPSSPHNENGSRHKRPHCCAAKPRCRAGHFPHCSRA